MTETEQRRKALLAQTRAHYSDKYAPPAIHPRWQNTYHSLYQSENSDQTKSGFGSFGVRMIVAIMLFCMFAFADYQGMGETKTVSDEIGRDYSGFVDFTFFD